MSEEQKRSMLVRVDGQEPDEEEVRKLEAVVMALGRVVVTAMGVAADDGLESIPLVQTALGVVAQWAKEAGCPETEFQTLSAWAWQSAVQALREKENK